MAPHKPAYFSNLVEGRFSAKIPGNDCHINHSVNTHFAHQRQNQGYSLKYVLSGVEKYEINGKYSPVSAGKFLVVNHGSNIAVEINSKVLVEGLCFYISTEILQDVWFSLHKTPEQLLEPQTEVALPAFYESIFDCRHNQLGTYILGLEQKLKTQPDFCTHLSEEVFYGLALNLCQQQNQHLKYLATVPALKKSTREELYHRLLTTRDYIHDNFNKPLSLEELAQVAHISEFHFLRSFKAVFGESPYQYINSLRLQLAKTLLMNKDQNIAELAFACGFKEVQSFSKLFRRSFGAGPALFRKQYIK